MSSEFAISVDELKKSYRVYNSPQDRLKQILLLGKKNYYQEYWALNGISFKVKKGETVGIVGKNGSGKSTLLQIISGTLKQTSGQVVVNGRISALLELGSGFNPDFTGRENIYMNGAILGLTKEEIDRRLPEIENFAEIGEFIDQPVKTYSSGMFLRLAFSCAVHTDPDILVVDEALAVGDMRFQLKCIERMKALKKQGVTIFFVSHDTYSIKNFCDEAIWIMDGRIHQRGNVNAVLENYEDYMRYELEPKETPAVISEKKGNILTIDKIHFIDNKGKKKSDFHFGESFSVLVDYTLYSEVDGLVGGVAIFDKQNTYVCGLNTKLDSYTLPTKPGKYQLVISYSNVTLLPGTYLIDVGFFESTAVIAIDYKSRAKYFRINSGEYFAEGLTLIQHKWSSERKDKI